MAIQKNHTIQNNCWSALSEDMSSDDEEIMNLTKSMLDVPSINDDMWKKFALPLTPPSSPSRTFGETTRNDERTEDYDIAERLEYVCECLDSAFDVMKYNVFRLTDAINLRSKLISDCMWSGNHSDDRHFCITVTTKKIKSESEEDLYPTPCPSPLPNVTEITDCPSSSECVDPSTVFPYSLQNESLSSLSDTGKVIF